MPGELLGKYRLLKLLARGGMGEVWLARQEGMKGFSKTVVVKKILEALAQDKAFAEMFVNEARLSALLTHPNIAQVFDLGEDQNGLYLAMEYVHGHSLRLIEQQLHKRGLTMPPELAARICQLALLGLHHAHRAVNDGGQPLNLVHRDVSPDNILVGYDGSVKVTDFGIAKATGSASSHFTQAGMVKGKVAYMPPEQLKAERLDGRTDVYAMGVVLYELLSGKRPFSAHTDTHLMLAIVQDDPKPLSEVITVDPALERIVLKALEKRPRDRFPSAAAMAEALGGFVETVRGSMDHAAIHRLLISLFGEASAKPPTTSSVDVMPAAGEGNATRAAPRTGAIKELYETSSGEVAMEPQIATKTSAAHGVATPAAAPPRASGLVFLAVIPAIAIGAGISVFVWMRTHAEPAAPVVVEPVTPAVVEPPPPPVEPVKPPPEVVEPVKPAAVAAVAKNGKVDLDVVPWGEVFLGKKSLGVTPMDPVSLPAGPQVLTVKNPELNVERKVKVNVPAGGTARVRVNLME